MHLDALTHASQVIGVIGLIVVTLGGVIWDYSKEVTTLPPLDHEDPA